MKHALSMLLVLGGATTVACKSQEEPQSDQSYEVQDAREVQLNVTGMT